MKHITRSAWRRGKGLGATLAAFCLFSLSLAPAYAADTEVYVSNGGGGSGSQTLLNPNVVLMLDNSGSMEDEVDTGLDPNVFKNKRKTHMKDGARSLLTSATGTTRVGIGTYKYQMLTGTKALNTVVGTYASTSGTVDMSIASGDDDVVQLAQDGSPNTPAGSIIPSQTTLDIAKAKAQGAPAPTPTYDTLSPSKVLLDTSYDRVADNAGGANGSVGSKDDCAVYSSGSGKSKRYYANICKVTITVPTKDDDGVTPLDNWYVTITADNTCTGCVAAKNRLVLRQDSFSGTIVASNSSNSTSTPATISSQKLTAGKSYYLIVGTSSTGDTGRVHVKVQVVAKDYRPSLPTTIDVHQRVGLRFNGVPIPAGATITSAYLYFYAAADSANRPNVTVGVDRTVSPLPFGDAAANNLYQRPNLTFYGTPANTTAWAASCRNPSLASGDCLDKQKYDVTAAVQALVNQAGWCTGDMLFVLKGDDPLKLASAVSYDGDPAYAPRLVINYSAAAASSTCKTIATTTQVSTEDAHQDANANALPDLKSTTLLLGDTKIAGMRFTNLHIYPNTSAAPVTVRDAFVEFTVASNANPGKLRFYIEQAGVSQGFSTRKNDLGVRLSPQSATVDWDVSTNPNWKAGSRVRSPSLKTLIQQILDRGQDPDSTLDKWEYGSSLALLVQGVMPNRSGAVYSYDYFAGSGTKESDYGIKAPRLVVLLDGKTSPENKTHRDYLLEQVKAMTFPNNTPLIATYYELARYYTGKNKDLYSGTPPAEVYASGKYLTPIDNGWDNGSQCQSNNLVLLTDGEPTADSGLNLASKIKNFTGRDCTDASDGKYWDCANKLAAYLAEHDGPKVITHTVGLGPDVAALQGLKDIATNGKGTYLAASDAGQLAAMFTDILNGATYQSASLAAPGVAVNQLNRFQHLSQVYYSVFKPSDKKDWAGNLKRYKFVLKPTGPEIQDARGNQAIDPVTNFFKDGTQSYWSAPVNDGPNVDQGGAASHMGDDFANRRVYTYLGTNPGNTSGQVNLLAVSTANSSQFTAAVFNTSDSSPANLASLLAWTRGDNGSGASRNLWGSPIHGQPVLVNYGYSGSDPEAAQSNEALQYNTIFASTNEGYLHAVDTGTGREIFTFIPQELLKNVETLKQNNSGALVNGLDSSWVVWRHDEDKDQKITTGSSGDWVYIYGGMRDGGRNYYSLDVTAAHPTASPSPSQIKLRFVLEGGKSGTAYQNMGYTWSVPTLGRIKYVTTTTDANGNDVLQDNPIPVMIFGGGYDPAHERSGDTNGVSDSTLARTQDTMGNQLYMVNAQTGELVWWASNDTNGASKAPAALYKLVSAMKWAIPSSVRTLDKDGDGYIDNLYFGDLGGQVWRVDIDNQATSLAGIVKRIKRIGSFGRVESATLADNRRFYEAPALALFKDNDGTRYVGVALGSGFRSRPLFTDTKERFYFLKDYEALKPDLYSSSSYDSETGMLKAANLADLTTATTATAADSALSGKSGWYLRLDNTAPEDQGEKVLSSPAIYAGWIIFTTYMPGSNKPTCGTIRGRSRYYAVSATNATAVQDFNNDGIIGDGSTKASERYKDYAGNGMLGTPQIVTDGNNAGVILSGGAGGGGLPPPPKNGVTRMRWYEKRN